MIPAISTAPAQVIVVHVCARCKSRMAASGDRSVEAGGLASWRANRVLAHVEQHLDGPLRSDALAALAGLSTGHFIRAFKARFGLPPHAYVLQRRIERAKGLMLATEDRRLAQIALICGLADQAHLSRVFRRFVGETPNAWRARQLQAIDAVSA